MYKIQQVAALHDSITGALTGLLGADNKEYMIPVVTVNGALISADGSFLSGLTNPLYGAVASANNYIQDYVWNKSSGVNASADFIVYPDNGTDASGWMDMGVTSSNFSQAAYSVTGPNEGYLFMSATAASGKSGDMVIATDSTGVSNSIRFYVNSFAKAIGSWSAKITGSNGLFSFASGMALTGKAFPNNGATVTYTYPANTSYVYLTTSAANLTITLPTVTGAAGVAIDGSVIEIVPSATVATVTWASTGGSFVGAPAAFTANVPVKMIYHHATLSWYPA
jgi:hypothetical protein